MSNREGVVDGVVGDASRSGTQRSGRDGIAAVSVLAGSEQRYGWLRQATDWTPYDDGMLDEGASSRLRVGWRSPDDAVVVVTLDFSEVDSAGRLRRPTLAVRDAAPDVEMVIAR